MCLYEKFIETKYTFIKIETAYTLSKQTSWKGVDLLNISMNSLLKVIGIECVFTVILAYLVSLLTFV